MEFYVDDYGDNEDVDGDVDEDKDGDTEQAAHDLAWVVRGGLSPSDQCRQPHFTQTCHDDDKLFHISFKFRLKWKLFGSPFVAQFLRFHGCCLLYFVTGLYDSLRTNLHLLLFAFKVGRLQSREHFLSKPISVPRRSLDN